jgi:hypothetical protein
LRWIMSVLLSKFPNTRVNLHKTLTCTTNEKLFVSFVDLSPYIFFNFDKVMTVASWPQCKESPLVIPNVYESTILYHFHHVVVSWSRHTPMGHDCFKEARSITCKTWQQSLQVMGCF